MTPDFKNLKPAHDWLDKFLTFVTWKKYIAQ